MNIGNVFFFFFFFPISFLKYFACAGGLGLESPSEDPGTQGAQSLGRWRAWQNRYTKGKIYVLSIWSRMGVTCVELRLQFHAL
jgi:hypothetical protein